MIHRPRVDVVELLDVTDDCLVVLRYRGDRRLVVDDLVRHVAVGLGHHLVDVLVRHLDMVCRHHLVDVLVRCAVDDLRRVVDDLRRVVDDLRRAVDDLQSGTEDGFRLVLADVLRCMGARNVEGGLRRVEGGLRRVEGGLRRVEDDLRRTDGLGLDLDRLVADLEVCRHRLDTVCRFRLGHVRHLVDGHCHHLDTVCPRHLPDVGLALPRSDLCRCVAVRPDVRCRCSTQVRRRSHQGATRCSWVA